MEKEQLINIVTKAQKGDGQALNQLFTDFYNDVYYFALKTVKDADLANDITQETFVEIMRTIGNLREPAAFVSWMKQITYHQCTRYFKKTKDVLVDEDEDGNTIFDELREEKKEFIPDEALEQEEFKKTILAIIDSLSPEQRAAVMMYYFDELSVSQIAQIQGVGEGTVKSRLNYARKAIKSEVENYEKKYNVKLHSFSLLPFLYFLFAGEKTQVAAAGYKTIAQAAGGTTTAVTGGVAAKAAAGTVTKAATKTATKGIVAKVAGVTLAAAVAVGATVTLMKPKEEKKEETVKIYTEFADIREDVLEMIESEEYEPYEVNEDKFFGDVTQYYKLPSDEFNILGYKESFAEESFFFEEYKIKTYRTGVYLYYEIPIKDEEEGIRLMKTDLKKANRFMKEVYDGNNIDPDYEPEVEEETYEDFLMGVDVLIFSVNEWFPQELGSLEGSSVDFKFFCKEKDGKWYYCPKIVMYFTEDTGGEWEAKTHVGMNIMEY